MLQLETNESQGFTSWGCAELHPMLDATYVKARRTLLEL